MKAQLLTTVLFSTLLFFGCFDNTVDSLSGNTTTSLIIKADNNITRSTKTIELTDIAGNNFTLTEARIGVRHVEFEMDNDSSYKIEGPFIVDLLTGSATPEIKTTDIPIGTYHRIDIRIDDTDENFPMITQDDSLYNYSLYAKGEYNNKEFIIKLKFNEDVRFDFASPVSIVDLILNKFVLTLKVSDWFSQIDLSECLNDIDDNEILIIGDKENSCNEVEGALKETIKNLYDFSSESNDRN